MTPRMMRSRDMQLASIESSILRCLGGLQSGFPTRILGLPSQGATVSAEPGTGTSRLFGVPVRRKVR